MYGSVWVLLKLNDPITGKVFHHTFNIKRYYPSNFLSIHIITLVFFFWWDFSVLWEDSKRSFVFCIIMIMGPFRFGFAKTFGSNLFRWEPPLMWRPIFVCLITYTGLCGENWSAWGMAWEKPITKKGLYTTYPPQTFDWWKAPR